MALKTDYKDDIPKTENRRYQMIHNDDGTVSFVDVTEYTQVGDTFGAGDINETNESVNSKVESTDIVDPALVTQEGFAADALAVKKKFDEQNKNLDGLIKHKDFVKSDNSYTANELSMVTNLDTHGFDGYIPFCAVDHSMIDDVPVLIPYILNWNHSISGKGTYLCVHNISGTQLNNRNPISIRVYFIKRFN